MAFVRRLAILCELEQALLGRLVVLGASIALENRHALVLRRRSNYARMPPTRYATRCDFRRWRWPALLGGLDERQRRGRGASLGHPVLGQRVQPGVRRHGDGRERRCTQGTRCSRHRWRCWCCRDTGKSLCGVRVPGRGRGRAAGAETVKPLAMRMRAHCRRGAQREEILGAGGARTRPKWRRQMSTTDKMKAEDVADGRMGAHAGDSVGRLR